MMNIIVLNGSPDLHGNTEWLIEGFKSGAELAGHKVSVFNLSEMDLCGCRGCNACKENETHECVQNDDMNQLFAAAKEAEMIVFASPIYFFSPSSWLQMGIECFHSIGFPKSLKQSAYLLTSGGAGVYSAALAQYRMITGYFGLQNDGVVTAHGAENKTSQKFEEAKKLGESLKSIS